MHEYDGRERAYLHELAQRVLRDRGFLAEFEPAVGEELGRIERPAPPGDSPDLRELPWCSIDNDDSRDLDQLTVAEDPAGGAVRARVAIADVDALVPHGSPIDRHAEHNTTSIYTAGGIFPMLPEKLSTNLTSLNEHEDRLAVIVDMEVAQDGSLAAWEVYRGRVHNHAQLAYGAVAAWLDGHGRPPPGVRQVPGLADQLRWQDEIAQRLRRRREHRGTLTFETIEPRARFEGESLVELQVERKNRARNLIEDFMIAANEATAQVLRERGYPALRRVVREPERWDRIMALAREQGADLPKRPDPRSLQRFLDARRAADPLRFPDLSLTVIKLLGSGEYVAIGPGREETAHFGLAVRGYQHSTAPNRRYPDVITQRLLKAALAADRSPYALAELDRLAEHCTLREDEANRAERQVRKSAAAMLLAGHVGERFDGVITGVSDRATWVRLLHPPVEGMLVRGFQDVDVGDRVRVELVGTDVEQGHIDFARR